MKVLITGGTGFIGSRLALKCLERGYDVKVLGQENTPTEAENSELVEKKGAEVVLASVADKELLHQHLEGIDIVFHLAATQHEMNVPDERFWSVNVEGTRNMLEASVNAGVKRFVHGSTIGVYGDMNGVISEETDCNPDNIYGVTKYEGEKLVLSYNDKVPVVVIRISETYGPGDHRLLKLFRAINKNVFFMIGNGQNLHHPIYVDDLVEGLLLAATSEEAVGGVFVLSGKEAVTTNEMVNTIAEQLAVSGPRFRVPLYPMWLAATAMELMLRPLGVQPPLHRRRMDFFRKGFTFSQDKATEQLGFKPETPFRQGVRETAEWYQKKNYLN